MVLTGSQLCLLPVQLCLQHDHFWRHLWLPDLVGDASCDNRCDGVRNCAAAVDYCAWCHVVLRHRRQRRALWRWRDRQRRWRWLLRRPTGVRLGNDVRLFRLWLRLGRVRVIRRIDGDAAVSGPCPPKLLCSRYECSKSKLIDWPMHGVRGGGTRREGTACHATTRQRHPPEGWP